jgi:hypothetical protein
VQKTHPLFGQEGIAVRDRGEAARDGSDSGYDCFVSAFSASRTPQHPSLSCHQSILSDSAMLRERSADIRGNWKAAEFKQYNFAAAGQPTEGGALHPLLKVREEFRQIFFDMG